MQTLMLKSPFIHKHHLPISPPFLPIPSSQSKSINTSKTKLPSPLSHSHQNTNNNNNKNKTKHVILGAMSVGCFIMFLISIDAQKALALRGPEGPLMEEFWDNVRRYGLYILTVSSGALYTIFQPIFELLKNPISAILVLVILGGGLFIVSQVVSAMIGATDFDYQYYY